MSATDKDVMPVGLRTRAPRNMIAIGDRTPRLSWMLEGKRDAVVQHGYEIEVSKQPDFTSAVKSAYIESAVPFDAAWPAAPLLSRDVRWCRVRVRTDRGLTDWSAPLRVEAALLEADDWIARPVSPVSNVRRKDMAPVALLRRKFHLPAAPRHARLYVTALGIHATTINGLELSSDLLDPGWTAYAGRHLYATYDVTDQLRAGENVLAAAVGDGWWRGELTWMQRRNVYGDTTGLLGQLEVELVDGMKVVIATDQEWRGGTGGWLEADLYHGSTLDMKLEPRGWREARFDDTGWEPVVLLDMPSRLEPRPMPAVQVIDVWTLEGSRTAWGSTIYDCGQNLTGWLSIRARGPAGAQIIVRHAEVLDDDGRLYTAALRNARATDSYLLDDSGEFLLEPLFTFHGFRFAEIIADAGVVIDRVEVKIISSDIDPTGKFTCSDPLVNRLWDNVRWSQRGNFLALPTDCPQRDERMGWTGDIQVFAQTACVNSDVGAFLTSWLKDLAVEQRADGCVPSVVPNVIEEHEFAWGATGWGDAATLTPWALYEAYGDAQVLRDQFRSMAAWVDWCASRLNELGVWEGDFQLGDWLDPGAPPDRPHEATTPSDYLASAYLAHSAAILAKAARAIDRDEEAGRYADLSRSVAAATWARWPADVFATQAGAAIAIEFGIAPEEELQAIGDQLARLVLDSGGRVATGFLGTPLILPALTRARRCDAAYHLLMNREAPGWLYQVLRGATTIWERWDAIREDGSINPGDMSVGEGASMLSFNHYAYGAVAAWLYRTVAGISPARPGYAQILYAPQPGGGLINANATINTPFGSASISWIMADDVSLNVEVKVPPGSVGRFIPPEGWCLADPHIMTDGLLSGEYHFACSIH